MTNDDEQEHVTPGLGEFRARYEADDNEWWRISCGHHQNLFDAACEEVDRLREELAAARATAWDEGREAGIDDAMIQEGYAWGDRTDASDTPNPYRANIDGQ